jgi:4-amino-4-deoxy-L-arabinose transferase-like glycosyltransferase
MLPLLLYPYSFWPPLWRALGGLRPRAADLGTRFCLAWTLPALAVFSLISGKQPHYLLPLFPGFALMTARLLDGPAPVPSRWAAVPAAAFLLLPAAALAAAPLLAHRTGVPAWAGEIGSGAGVLLGLAALACILFSGRIFAGRPAAPSLFSLLLIVALFAAGSKVIRDAYDVRPAARYLAAAEHEGRPIAWAGDYHGQLHFLGRLTRPFEEIPAGAEAHWLREHPGGKLVEELFKPSSDVARAAFVQPYRTGILAVWDGSAP